MVQQLEKSEERETWQNVNHWVITVLLFQLFNGSYHFQIEKLGRKEKKSRIFTLNGKVSPTTGRRNTLWTKLTATTSKHPALLRAGAPRRPHVQVSLHPAVTPEGGFRHCPWFNDEQMAQQRLEPWSN